MKVLSIVFNDNARPLRNNTFIDVGYVGHTGVEMSLLDGGIVSVVFPAPTPGFYGIPVSSLSHIRLAEDPASPVVCSPKCAPAEKKQRKPGKRKQLLEPPKVSV